jgi:hypothetical protein
MRRFRELFNVFLAQDIRNLDYAHDRLLSSPFGQNTRPVPDVARNGVISITCLVLTRFAGTAVARGFLRDSSEEFVGKFRLW